MLQMFYQSVMASALFYAAFCWGGSVKHKDARRLDKLVERAGSVIGTRLDSLEAVVERRTQKKVEAILNYTDPPLHNIFMDQRNSDSGQLIFLRCRTERYRRSFIPADIWISFWGLIKYNLFYFSILLYFHSTTFHFVASTSFKTCW